MVDDAGVGFDVDGVKRANVHVMHSTPLFRTNCKLEIVIDVAVA